MATSDAHDLGEITRRLAEIDAALQDEYRQPSPERYELLKERDALRARAVAHRSQRDASRPTGDLRAELEQLKRRLKTEVSSHTGYATSMGGGNASPSPGAWVELGALSRAAGGFDRLRARITEIEDELERRESAE